MHFARRDGDRSAYPNYRIRLPRRSPVLTRIGVVPYTRVSAHPSQDTRSGPVCDRPTSLGRDAASRVELRGPDPFGSGSGRPLLLSTSPERLGLSLAGKAPVH